MNSLQAFLDAINADRYNHGLHMVFADWLDEHGLYDDAAYQRAWTPQRQKWEDAERWLRDYAIKMNGHDDPEAAFARLIEGLESRYLLAMETDLHGLYELDDADELRENAETYLKKPIADWEYFEFSCSC